MPGLQAEVILHEPAVRQPVFFNFDEKGRIWVVQFLQYPYPAGVRIVDLDDQFHAVYDRVPPAPPNHVRGADRITIHSDRDGDGLFETHKVFLDGLNITTAVERGRAGVWVLNPPYLLFYPDRNDDDLPDSDPIVHLSGFGLEDTHSTANSLRWGPDGWLYGAHGSGCSATIRRPGLDDAQPGFYFKGQAIWRYHPAQRRFELFSEGGGNTYGLEFDVAGRAYSGLNGGGHRGFHFVQGGYYNKNFGEHGYFTNPHAFGHFNVMNHDQQVPRFSHTFVIYEAKDLPHQYHQKIIAPVPLQHHLVLSELFTHGSTFQTRDLGLFLESSDAWFRPVDIKTGPDGAVYVADWYDTRLTHMDPRDTWDRHHGRIYRIKSAAAYPQRRVNLAQEPSSALVPLLSHPNKWFRQTALRLIADRQDQTILPSLNSLLNSPDAPVDALWALHLLGAFNSQSAPTLLRHSSPPIREWTVRLLGDNPDLHTADIGALLQKAASQEPSLAVRSQLASTARRLPGEIALPILFSLARQAADASDPHIPLLLWWALESKAISHRTQIVQSFSSADVWTSPILRNDLAHRLARRYASQLTPENQSALSLLLRSAPDSAAKNELVRGINDALKGRGVQPLMSHLESALQSSETTSNATQLALALRRDDPKALTPAISFILRKDPSRAPDQLQLIEALGETAKPEVLPALLQLLFSSTQPTLQSAALNALSHFDDPSLPDELFAQWAHLDLSLRRQAIALLATRAHWAKRLISAAGNSGTLSKQDIPIEVIERLRLWADPELAQAVQRHFGQPRRASSAEKQTRINTLANAFRTHSNPNLAHGKSHFMTRCSACHRLHGQGSDIGPDLTPLERNNIENMLLSLIDPNAGIREGYTLFQIDTKDGRSLAGFITDRAANQITLRDPSGQLLTVPTEQITSEKSQNISLMPEGLLDDLTPSQIADLLFFLSK